jgi:Ca2+-binding EF-hand superfamily protein
MVAQPKPEEIREAAGVTAQHLHQTDIIAPDECDLLEPLPRSQSCAEMPLTQEQEVQIVNAFRLFDTNDSGFLDVQEMHSALFALGYLSDYRDDLSASIKLVKDLLTPGDDSNGVSRERFRDIMRGSLIEKGGMEEICMTFDAIINMTSSLTFPGLSSSTVVVESHFDGPSTELGEEASAAQGSATPDAHAGTINSKAKNIRRGVFPMLTSVTGSSKAVDSTVGITFEKLRRACHRFDVRLTDDELRRVIHETDRNRNGYVDKPEYIHVLKNSCWF